MYNNDPNHMATGKGGAEFDILEVFGVPNIWTSGIHMRNYLGEGRGAPMGEANEDLYGWHVYGFDWQSNYLRLYRDGVLRSEIVGTDAYWYATTMGVRLNYSMDAPWFGTKSDASTPNELTMEVDYVRVYRQKP